MQFVLRTASALHCARLDTVPRDKRLMTGKCPLTFEPGNRGWYIPVYTTVHRDRYYRNWRARLAALEALVDMRSFVPFEDNAHSHNAARRSTVIYSGSLQTYRDDWWVYRSIGGYYILF